MQWFAVTDKGRLRPTNQDIYRMEVREAEAAALLVVCDGMGGANAGNVASRFAAETFVNVAAPAMEGERSAQARSAAMLAALECANETVFELARRQPEFRGMGTTLVAALVQDGQATLLNVGDSRGYMFDGEGLLQITQDHSYVEEMRRQGKLSEEAARTHPQKNLITRAVGVDPEVEGDLFELTLLKGQTLLLCTDGLSGMVEDGDMAKTLCQAPTLALAGDELLHMALENGGRDNVTLALLRWQPAENEEA